jgi:PAS domain S-box-containing protein
MVKTASLKKNKTGFQLKTILLVAVVYFLTAKLGLLLAFKDTNATPVWPATGIAFAAVFFFGYRIWPGLFLGAFCANALTLSMLDFSVASSVLTSLSTAGGNTLEALAGVYLTKQICHTRNPFDQIDDTLAFVIRGVFFSTLIGATIGTTSFFLNFRNGTDYSSMWINWWLGDSIGAIIVTPIFLTWNKKQSTQWSFGKISEAVLLLIAILAFFLFIFLKKVHLEYMIIPLLLWTVQRFNRFETAIIIFIISVISILLTINGSGPFYQRDLNQSLLLLQSYTGIIALSTIILSVIITEQRQTKVSLQETQQRIRDIIDFLPDATFAIDYDNKVIVWNRAIEEMTGVSASEILGKGNYEYALPFFGKRQPILIDFVFSDQEDLRKNYVTIKKIGDRYFAESNVCVVKGRLLALAGAAQPFYDINGKIVGAIESIRDISQQKQAEKALQESEQKYRELVQNANSIILRWDRNAKVTFMNEFGQRFFGYHENEIIGKHVVGTIVPETESSGRELRRLMDEICENPSAYEHNTNENIRRDGSHVWIAWANRAVLDAQGQLVEVFSVGSDITKQKQAQDGLQQSERNYREVFNATSEAILIHNAETGAILEINETGLKMYGYSVAEMKNLTINDISLGKSPYSQQEASLWIKKAVEEKPQLIEWVAKRKTGEVFWTEITLQSSHIGGEGCVLAVVRDISSRKQTEATLQGVFQAAPVGICMMKDRRYQSVNDQWIKSFGYSKEELIGTTTRALYENDEEYQRIGQELYGPLQKQGVATINTRLRRKDGSFRDVILNAASLQPHDPSAGVVVTIHDVTERNQAEKALKESEQRYRNLIEKFHDIVVITDLTGKMLYANPALKHQTGFTIQDFEFLQQDNFLNHYVDAEGMIKFTKDFIDSNKPSSATVESIFSDRHDTVHWHSFVITKTDYQGQPAMQFLIHDITERKQAEENIHELLVQVQQDAVELEKRIAERTAELSIAKDRAESADRIKSAFLATMSHELRTPLNSIIGFTGILTQGLAGPMNEEQTKQLGMVQNSASHLLALINDVLDISKIEAGQLEVFLKRFDFRKSIEKVIMTVRPLAERKGLVLLTNISPKIIELDSDARRVEQILLNLLTNAIKFTDAGTVTVESEIVDNRVVTRVSDTGIGIAEEDFEKLFKPFSQVDTGTTRAHEGTGLGLSICKKLMDKLNGTIMVQSKQGVGSTFTVTFPME